MPDHLADEMRTSRRLEMLAGLVGAAQVAPDEDAMIVARATCLRGSA